MAKDKKKCKKCEENGEKSCKCPKKGYYGLERYGDEDDHPSDDGSMDMGGGDGGAMGESVKMPKAPTDSETQGLSTEKKQKSLDKFKNAASDAKKRQSYKDENDELAVTRMRKGIRFYDSKGSGYMKGGKKTYD